MRAPVRAPILAPAETCGLYESSSANGGGKQCPEAQTGPRSGDATAPGRKDLDAGALPGKPHLTACEDDLIFEGAKVHRNWRVEEECNWEKEIPSN